jgi:hypothetical protein
MSRGPGRIQQAIVGLIEADPQGAWTTTELCEYIYRSSVERWDRVAVAQALRGMKLPPLWCVRRTGKQGAEHCLYNAGDVESTLRAAFAGDAASGYAWNFEAWKARYPHRIERARKDVGEALRYYNASPVEKLAIEVSELRRVIELLHMASASEASPEISQLARHAGELIDLREALKAAFPFLGSDEAARPPQRPAHHDRQALPVSRQAGESGAIDGRPDRMSRRRPAMTLDGKCILIAEDEGIIAMDLAAEVAAWGGEVVGPVASIDAALDIIASMPLDGAILDLNLKGQMGFLVADALADRDIPFVFETAYMKPGEAPSRHAHVPCIEKPFTRSFVRHALERVMSPRDQGLPLA